MVKTISLLVVVLAIVGCQHSKKKPRTAKQNFSSFCASCHGIDGKLGLGGAKDLSKTELDLAGRIDVISNGRNAMAGYKTMMAKEDIEALAEYIGELK